MHKRRNSQLLILGLVSAAVLILTGFLAWKSSFPYVFNDEFGYWVSAARWNGWDWNSIYSRIPYYSFGYSPFLYLMIQLMPNIIWAYRGAVFLNGIWVVGSIWLLYTVGRSLFPEKNVAVYAVVAGLYTSNIAQMHYTWPECFLYFLFCLQTYLLIRLWKHSTFPLLMGYGLLLGWSYFIHQRTLGIVIAGSAALLVLVWQKRISWKQLAAAGTVFVLVFGILLLVKQDVSTAIWTRAASFAGNNFSGQTGKLKTLLTVHGIWNLFLSFLCKSWYVFQSSFFLVPFGLYICCDRLIGSWRKPDIWTALGVFLLLSWLGSRGINSLFMIDAANVSHLVYGRYIDNLYGPFLLIAMLDRRMNWKVFGILLLLYTGLDFVVRYQLEFIMVHHHDVINVAGTGNLVEDTGISFKKAALELAFFWGSYWFCSLSARLKKLWLLVPLSAFLFTGWRTYDKFRYNWAYSARSTQAVVQMLESLPSKPAAMLYIEDGAYPLRYFGNGIQFLMPDSSFTVLEEGDPLPESGYLLTVTNSDSVPQGAVLLLQTEAVDLYDLSSGV